MSDSYNFEIPTNYKSIIKVIGVGGGGSNAVNHMYNQGIRDVEFVVCNTDSQALENSPVPNKLQIGINLTEGLGAGANPETGKNAALESKDEIRDLLSKSTKMLFVTAGMGGGTGTGAAPVIANIAKEMGILTVGIVTAPFMFEGIKKMDQAQMGIKELKENCDTVIVILNDKLREIYGNLSITKAFAEADNVLTTAAKGIAEIITVPGYVNVDFQDVNTVMRNSGAAVMGSATTEGDNRARRAAEEAISSPLLNNENIHGCKKILLSIISGEEAELQMDELTAITEFIQEIAGDEAEVIFGHGIDQALDSSLRVTLIATGFDHEMTIDTENYRKVFDLETANQIDLFDGNKEEEPKEIDIQRTYTFDIEPKTGEEEEDEFDQLSGLQEEYELVQDEEDQALPKKEMREEENEHKSLDMVQKKHQLQMQAMARAEKLRGGKNPTFDITEYKEKLDVPAYVRRNVQLRKVPHSADKNISKYNLNDDNEMLGNNRFLHDNVD